jgi:electron-transferring-flavoprotein dehydrogenase
VFENLTSDNPEIECVNYTKKLEQSWLYKELKAVRNIRPAFNKGLWRGILRSTWETITGGRLSGTKRNHSDHEMLKPAKDMPKINYPKPDGIITFDKLSSVFLSNTNHEEDQPCHLKLKDKDIPIQTNLKDYDAPEQRYCPAGVYEIIRDENGENPKLQINAQNCVHCKTCDIKDPKQNIKWTPPQGGGGPNYPNM